MRKRTHAFSSNRMGKGLVCGVAACAMAALLSSCAPAFEAVGHGFETQDDGSTWGVPAEGADGLVDMPDMMRVQGNGGKIGYVSNDDMMAASFDFAEPQDRSAGVSRLNEMRKDAFVAGAQDYFGSAVLSDEDAQRIVDVLYKEGGQQAAAAIVQDAAGAKLADLINASQLDTDTAAKLVLDAVANGTLSVEVPEVGQPLFATKTTLPFDMQTAFAGWDQAYAQACAVVDRATIDPVAASDVHVSSIVFYELSDAASDYVAAEIPLYNEAGDIIGTYTVDRL